MMKRIFLFVLFVPCAGFAAPDVSAIKNAATIDDAKSAYQSVTSEIISSYKDKISESDVTAANNKVTEVVENITAVPDDKENKSDNKKEVDESDKNSKSDDGDADSDDDTPRLSQEDHDKKIAELRDNAQKMHDKEQSQANRVLGGATMMATGMGGMQMMSGMAEQKADEDAEQSMKAYLETFRCDYGMGRNIKGGETEIELPGANDLLPLVTEYKELAADLKIRKEALGKMPGIESEEIIDPATSGLYDNVGIGKTGGAYTSVYRALTDENSEDAKAWAEQKQDAHDKKNTGLKVLAGGAVASIAADMVINKNAPKENSAGINNKYKGTESAAETDQRQGAKDAKDATELTECPGELQSIDGVCKCLGDKQQTKDNRCIDRVSGITCDAEKHLVINSEGTACECADTFVQVEPSDKTKAPTKCDCPYGKKIGASGQCVEKKAQVEVTDRQTGDFLSGKENQTIEAVLLAQTSRPDWAEMDCPEGSPAGGVCLGNYAETKVSELDPDAVEFINGCYKLPDAYIGAEYTTYNKLILECFSSTLGPKFGQCQALMPSKEGMNPTGKNTAVINWDDKKSLAQNYRQGRPSCLLTIQYK